MKNSLLLLSFLAFGLIYSCKKEEVTPDPGPDTEVEEDQLTYTTSPIDLMGIDAKFSQDISYDTKERTKLDVWIPESDEPTGLLIYVHGGGFTSGDKSYVYNEQKGGEWDFPGDIRTLLTNKIAVATVNYTYLKSSGETDGVLKPMNDVKRALQYIRNRSTVFNIDKDNIVMAGNSAGAGTSLWLATSDDMNEPGSADPVLKESTRIKGIAILETQATYNVDKWITDIFVDYGLTIADITSNPGFSASIARLYGITSLMEYDTPETEAYRASVDMLEHLTSDDPEIWVENVLTEVAPPSDLAITNHHAYHAREIKEKADLVGVPNVAYYGKDPILFEDPSNESWVNFIIRKINE